MIYNFVALFSLYLTLFIKNKKNYLIIIFGLLALIAGMRASSVGSDTSHYNMLYYSWEGISYGEILDTFPSKPEIGTWGLVKISSIILDMPQTFILFMSVLSFLFLVLFIYYNVLDEYYVLATYLVITTGVFFSEMNISRQFLAMSISINSLYYLRRNQICRCIGICLLGTLFHYSVLIYIPFILITYAILIRMRDDSANVKLLIIGVIGTLVFVYFACDLIISNMDAFGGMYLSYFAENSSNGGTRDLRIATVVRIVLYGILLLLINIKAKNNDEKKYRLIIGNMIIFLIFMLMGQITFMAMIARLVDLFAICIIVAIPLWLSLIRNKYMKAYIVLLIYVIGFIYMNNLMTNNAYDVMPYIFFVNDI